MCHQHAPAQLFAEQQLGTKEGLLSGLGVVIAKVHRTDRLSLLSPNTDTSAVAFPQL